MKALNQNGYEQVEEDVVAEGHEGYEIEGSQGRGGGHPVIEHRVPVLLGEDLSRWQKSNVCRDHKNTPSSTTMHQPCLQMLDYV